MKKQAIVVIVISLLMAGCCTCRSLVKRMRETIKDMRERDYQKGRVVFSETAAINSKVLTSRIERMMDAENAAAVYLEEDKPFPDVKASAKDAISGK